MSCRTGSSQFCRCASEPIRYTTFGQRHARSRLYSLYFGSTGTPRSDAFAPQCTDLVNWVRHVCHHGTGSSLESRSVYFDLSVFDIFVAVSRRGHLARAEGLHFSGATLLFIQISESRFGIRLSWSRCRSIFPCGLAAESRNSIFRVSCKRQFPQPVASRRHVAKRYYKGHIARMCCRFPRRTAKAIFVDAGCATMTPYLPAQPDSAVLSCGLCDQQTIVAFLIKGHPSHAVEFFAAGANDCG